MIVLNFHHKHDHYDSTSVLPIRNIINMFTMESKHFQLEIIYSTGHSMKEHEKALLSR